MSESNPTINYGDTVEDLDTLLNSIDWTFDDGLHTDEEWQANWKIRMKIHNVFCKLVEGDFEYQAKAKWNELVPANLHSQYVITPPVNRPI